MKPEKIKPIVVWVPVFWVPVASSVVNIMVLAIVDLRGPQLITSWYEGGGVLGSTLIDSKGTPIGELIFNIFISI